jgi:hypothetical protein
LCRFNRFVRLYSPVQQLLPSLPQSFLPSSRLNLPCLTEHPSQLPVRPSCRCRLHLISLRLSLMLHALAMK